VAEDAQLTATELESVRRLQRVLRQVTKERQKAKARANLQAAESSHNLQELKSAIQDAEVARLPQHELDTARKALAKEEQASLPFLKRFFV